MKGAAQAFASAAQNARAAARVVSSPIIVTPVRTASERQSLLLGLMVWTLIVLMVVPEGFDYSTLDSENAPESGGFISRLMWFGLLSGSLIMVALRGSAAWRLVRSMNVFLLAFVLLAAASTLWSIEPTVTMRRTVRIVTMLSVAIAFAMSAWHAQRFQNVLRPIITAVLAASLAFGIAYPEFAIHQDGDEILIGAWRGLANHKNGLGSIACLGIILWFHAWLSREVRLLPALVGIGLASVCLILSRSSTALVVTAFSLLFLTMLLRSPSVLRRSMPYLILLFVGALLVYSLVLLQILPGLSVLQSPISAITGKDMTLTGRSEIWNIITAHIQMRPWLGTGYGAYWTGAYEGAASYDFMTLLNFYPGSAHNGYLEIVNDLGTVGLLVLLGYLALFSKQSVELLRGDRAQAALLLALFMQQAITNLSESRWLSALSVDFVVMTLATTSLARARLEQRQREKSGSEPDPRTRAAQDLRALSYR
ncbi:MAG: O-antigen ligase family protein [Pseudomonadota bacterium]|nr:O-antigen ligase family protein [Pseudomonadota bacterium]